MACACNSPRYARGYASAPAGCGSATPGTYQRDDMFFWDTIFIVYKFPQGAPAVGDCGSWNCYDCQMWNCSLQECEQAGIGSGFGEEGRTNH